jgi:Na+-translocating ferredoxin:NAD+ oxidoreductase RnfD subunit
LSAPNASGVSGAPPPAPPVAPPGAAPMEMPQWKKFISLENRYIAPIFITLILLVGHLTFGILESYQKTLLAIAASIGAELILSRLFFGKWPIIASAYISGISVGILLRSPAFWPYAVCSIVSITSKYVLRVNGRHIWNPSNFGISVMLFLAPETVASLSIQWGNYLLPMIVIWVLGSVIIWRLRRFHITGIYVASFLMFAFLRSWMTGSPLLSEIAPITGPMYQLFIFFMITDPKTTVRSKTGQCVTVFVVALLEMVLRLDHVVYAPLYALFIVGPAAMLVEMWLDARRSGRAAVAVVA